MGVSNIDALDNNFEGVNLVHVPDEDWRGWCEIVAIKQRNRIICGRPRTQLLKARCGPKGPVGLRPVYGL